MKKIAVILVNKVEEVEALFPTDLLRRAGVHVDLISSYSTKKIIGSHNIVIEADKTLLEVDFDDYDGIFLPGGPGASEYEKIENLDSIVNMFYSKEKLVSAICAAPLFLAKIGLLENKKSTIFTAVSDQLKEYKAVYVDLPVVKEGNIITGRSVAAACDFGLALIEYLLGYDKCEQIKANVIYYGG